MTKIYLTADYHLDHANIILYTNRPFILKGDITKGNKWVSDKIKERRKEEMNSTIVKNHNSIVNKDDIVFHLGDFCFKGVRNASSWESKLNGHIIQFRGNHDKNISDIQYAIIMCEGSKIFATHIPPLSVLNNSKEDRLIKMCDFIVCGHVHNSWKHIKIREKICVNVGIDVWDYKPVPIHSILKYVDEIEK
ncbi:MAG: metallophosphoesterase family protein [bacterium]